jgi:hypothetical protein
VTTTPSESDPFFQLLTEALRAGPGSAQWGEAVAKLRDGGIEGADEFRLIIRAREDLEKGRDFRRITAGPGFTRKVLEAVEQEGGRKHNGIPTATIMAILAGLVILAVIVTGIVMMSGDGGGGDAREAAVRKLEATSFPVAVTSATFVRDPQMSSDAWRTVGALPLDTTRGLKAGVSPSTAPTTSTIGTTQASGRTIGGAIVTAQPLPADEAAAVEAEVVPPPDEAGQPLVQIFVSDSNDFSPETATSPREIVWTYRGGRASIDAAGAGQRSLDIGSSGQTLKMSIRFDGQTAIVEAGGRRMFAGPHGLTPGAARYAGVRFIRAAGEAGPSATVRSVNVSRAAGPTGGQ